MAKDYYKILGVGKSASAEEIKAAFRKLAHQYHPDKAGGNAEKFKEVNEAYQVLSSPEKRAQYDQFGSTFEQAQRQGGFSGFGGFRDFSDFAEAFRGNGGQAEVNMGDLGDLFGSFFGGAARTSTARRQTGADVEAQVAVSLQEAFSGAERELELTLDAACDVCGGTGAEPGTEVVTCTTCRGRGSVTRSIGFGIGVSAACPDCGGAGRAPQRRCKHCRGQGSVRKTTAVRFKIPAGIDDGQTIRLVGKGAAGGRGARPGDLYVHVRVGPHPRLTRDGADLKVGATVTLSQAALGSAVTVPTLSGEHTVKVPEGTQSGSVIRVRGHGMPHVDGGGRGDLLVTVEVRIPTRLTREQRRLLDQLRDAGL